MKIESDPPSPPNTPTQTPDASPAGAIHSPSPPRTPTAVRTRIHAVSRETTPTSVKVTRTVTETVTAYELGASAALLADRSVPALPTLPPASSQPRTQPRRSPLVPQPNAPQFREPTNTRIGGYFMVSRGEEVGVYFHWNDVEVRTKHVTMPRWRKCDNRAEAIREYTKCYNQNLLEPVPRRGGPFWHPSSSESIHDDDDLSSYFNGLSV